MREAKLGIKNPQWKGEKVKYEALHEWVRAHMTSPKLCMNCRSSKNIDLANKGVYDRSLNNWEWLCRKCHMVKDGRAEDLQKVNTFVLSHK